MTELAEIETLRDTNAESDQTRPFTAADLDAHEAEFAQIERAMAGLQDGTYGRCAQCGSAIVDEILSDDPLAVSCGGHLIG